MNSFVNDIFERFAAEPSRLAHYNKRSTINPFLEAIGLMNSFVNDNFERFAAESSCLAYYNKRSNIAQVSRLQKQARLRHFR